MTFSTKTEEETLMASSKQVPPSQPQRGIQYEGKYVFTQVSSDLRECTCTFHFTPCAQQSERCNECRESCSDVEPGWFQKAPLAQAPPPNDIPGVILVPQRRLIHLYSWITALTCLLFFPTPFKLVIDDSVAMTPFYLLLGKHRRQKQENGDGQSSRGSTERTPLPKGSVGVKEVGVCVG